MLPPVALPPAALPLAKGGQGPPPTQRPSTRRPFCPLSNNPIRALEWWLKGAGAAVALTEAAP